MEPITEFWSINISSAAHANQYPPDAATSSTKAITFLFFYFDKSIIFFAISDDCVGEPPGELIIIATAGAFLSENNFSINLSRLLIARPDPVIPDCEDIIPESLRVGIWIFLENNLLNILFNNKSYSFHKGLTHHLFVIYIKYV